MALDNVLPRQTPEAQGIPSSAISAFVDAVQAQINELHSFMLVRHGAVVAEAWWLPYAPDRRHMLYSLSKSFTSTAIGLAIEEKRLSLDDTVLSYFPDDAPTHVSKNLAAMQVRHLLSMSTGHALDTMPALGRRHDGNWTKAFLSCPVKHQPGTYFLYNTGATYMLSAILQKITGITLLEYLQPRLLEPLGIKNATWEISPQGICMGGFGMSITTEDIAKFGQLYLQNGMWNNKRLIPESWVDKATSCQIANYTNDEQSDWQQGYGYQFWRCRHNAYRGDGAFGQYCVVMPEQDAVLAITSGVGDMQVVLNVVWQHLLPAMGSAPLAAQPDAVNTLKDKLDHLAYLPPTGESTSSIVGQVSGKPYIAEQNSVGIKQLAFDFTEQGCTLTLRTAQGNHEIICGDQAWVEGKTTLFGSDYPGVAASGTWTSGDTFTVTLRFYETPYIHTLNCHFKDDTLTVDGKLNVSFGPTSYRIMATLKA